MVVGVSVLTAPCRVYFYTWPNMLCAANRCVNRQQWTHWTFSLCICYLFYFYFFPLLAQTHVSHDARWRRCRKSMTCCVSMKDAIKKRKAPFLPSQRDRLLVCFVAFLSLTLFSLSRLLRRVQNTFLFLIRSAANEQEREMKNAFWIYSFGVWEHGE